MAARPDLTPNQGKAYRLTMTAFRGNADRLNAFEAGQIDLATSAAPSTLFAAEQGVPLKVLASIAREKQGAFNTTYLALEDFRIRSPADVRGKTVGIVDFKSATELWARAAIKGAGLNPDRDVSFVVVPFPGMGEALRAKRIDVGVFPEPFVTVEKGRGGVVQVWTAKTGVPFEEELLDLIVGRSSPLRTVKRCALSWPTSSPPRATTWSTPRRRSWRWSRKATCRRRPKYTSSSPTTTASRPAG